MSRLHWITTRALGAAVTALVASGAVSSGCVGKRGPPGEAGSGEAAPGEAGEAWVLACSATGSACGAGGCCSNNCSNRTCVCAPLGGACQSEEDCCDKGCVIGSSGAGTCSLVTCGVTPNYGVSGSGANGNNPSKNVYWGNLHQHTGYSLDAYYWGATSTPAQAYAFADGSGNGTQTQYVQEDPNACTPCTGTSCACLGTIACTANQACCASPTGGPSTCVPYVQVGGGTGPVIYPQQPLDFLAITDHSEWMAPTYACLEGDVSDCGTGSTATTCNSLVYYGNGRPYWAAAQTESLCGPVIPSGDQVNSNLSDRGCSSSSGSGDWPNATPMNATCAGATGYYTSAWNSTVSAAYTAYNPCSFTSLVAYEWTGMTSGLDPDSTSPLPMGGNTNHRNVIFNNGASASLPEAPCDTLYCAPSPAALWTSLNESCLFPDTGCDAVTLPHNTNESDGLSLIVQVPTVNESVAEVLGDQVHYQVSAEIYQHKGSSECYPPAGPTVIGGTGNLGPEAYAGMSQGPVTYEGAPDTACNFENASAEANVQALSYVRSALESGVGTAAQAALGMQGNPLQLGIVGATDDHNAAPGYVEEEVFVGHHGNSDAFANQRVNGGSVTFSPGGLTGVWAEQNTRDRIFAAIQRRETFATSGPRMQVRFYQYNGTSSGCGSSGFPQGLIAGGGVPMGGTFGPASLGGASASSTTQPPTFIIQVTTDPHPQAPAPSTLCNSNTNCAATGSVCCATGSTCNVKLGVCVAPVGIYEVQVVKGYSQGGTTYEDAPITIATNPGSPFCQAWTDATGAPGAKGGDFNASQYAFYYVRVLQSPTYRWSHWDCNPPLQLCSVPGGCAAGTACCPSGSTTCTQNTCVPTACSTSSCADGYTCCAAGSHCTPNTCVPTGCSTGNTAAFVNANDQINERAWTSPIWYSPDLQYTVLAGGGGGNGEGGYGGNGGPGDKSTLGNYPSGMAKDAAGNLYIADTGNAVIRKIDTSGVIGLFAGTPGTPGHTGDGTPAISATINTPSGVAVDTSGNVYFSEVDSSNVNNDIRMVNAVTGLISTYAPLLGPPGGISMDGSNNLYVAMLARDTIVKITPANASTGGTRWAGILNTTGSANSCAVVGGSIQATFKNPNGVWADTFGNVYVNDSGNGAIRKYDGVAKSPGYGCFTTIAGEPALGPGPTPTYPVQPLPEGVAATSIQIDSKYGIVADALGNVFFPDTSHGVIRMINPAGNIYTLTPGTGASTLYPKLGASPGFPGGAAVDLLLVQPGYSWMDGAGAMYFSDASDNVYKLSIH